MKRAFSIALIVALLMALTGFSALADEDYKVKATASVNLRKGPGTGYAIYTSVSSGKSLTYRGISKFDSKGTVWHNVTYDKTSLWLTSKYSKLTYDGTTISASGYVKATANVNLRKGPGSSYAKLGSLKNGEKVFYLGDTHKNSNGYKWYKVSTSAGVAWVSGSYSKLYGGSSSTGTSTPSTPTTGKTVVSTGSVNLRKGPGLDCTIYTSVKKGVSLKYLGETTKDDRGVKWYKVEYKNKDLWISSVYSKLK